MEKIPVCFIRTQLSMDLEGHAFGYGGGGTKASTCRHLWDGCAWWDLGQGRLVPLKEEMGKSRDWKGGLLLMGAQSRAAWK